MYGRAVSAFDSLSATANQLIEAEFTGRSLFDHIEAIANVTFEDINERLQHQLDPENISLSVVKGIDE